MIKQQKKILNSVVIASFDGMPAVGKTTLAVRIAYLMSKEYPDAQLFIDCYGYTSGHEPLKKEQILDSLLFALGIPITYIPEKYVDKLSLWRSQLNNLSVIIVLDNIKSANQIDELIPSNTNSLFIITSRDKLMLDDSHSITLDVINTDSAVLVLNGGKEENNLERYELLSKLARKHGYLPLALQIISHQIKGKNNKYIRRLLDSENGFENLNAINNAVLLSFDLSYQQLKDIEKSLFQVLGVFPGYDFNASSCAALLGMDTTNIYISLDILFQQNLIKEVEEERYVLHDLLRDFSRKKYYENNQHDLSPLVRLTTYYIECINHCNNILYPYNYMEPIESEYPWGIDNLPLNQKDAFIWLKTELNNILSCLNAIHEYQWTNLYFKLSYVLSQYILKGLPGWQVVRIYQKACSYKNLDKWMCAAIRTNLALAYYHAGNFDMAVSIFCEAERFWKELENWQALAYTLGNHAFTLERLGKYPDALDIIQKALEYANPTGNRSIVASILNNKGAVYWRMHEYSIARDIFEEVIEIRKQLGDTYGASNTINNLAFTLLCLGDVQGAQQGFTQSLELASKFQDYSGEAVTLNNFGYTELYINHPYKAIDYAKSAFHIAAQIGDDYQIARSFDVKGKAYLQLNDVENAISNFKSALQLFLKLNVPEANEVRTIIHELEDQL